MNVVFLVSALVSVLAVFLIFLFLFANGIPAIGKIGPLNFLTGSTWKPSNDLYGIFPMILGSIYVTAGAVAIGVPIGILVALYLAMFCPRSFYRIIKPAVELLAGIPSVVYGYFALVVLVPWVRETFGGHGSSMLAASLLLAVMILPTIINVSESAIRAVPRSYYEGGLALGSSHERTSLFVVLPAARSAVLAGVILGIGRAVGETMAVVMVAGNQARLPRGLLYGVRTLTANIVIEMGYAAGLHREALIATGVVLFIFILLINLSFSLLVRREK